MANIAQAFASGTLGCMSPGSAAPIAQRSIARRPPSLWAPAPLTRVPLYYLTLLTRSARVYLRRLVFMLSPCLQLDRELNALLFLHRGYNLRNVGCAVWEAVTLPSTSSHLGGDTVWIDLSNFVRRPQRKNNDQRTAMKRWGLVTGGEEGVRVTFPQS